MSEKKAPPARVRAPSPNATHLGRVVDEWTGCYPSNWKGLIVAEAMAHPAKYSSRLIRRIYQHMVVEGWVRSGDNVVDPFGGVALGGLDAMRLGLNWYGVELEERFWKLGNENIELWEGKFGHMLRGSAHLARGDSRKLREVLGLDEWVMTISSPPYAESIQTSERGSGIDYSKAMNGGKGRTAGREAIATGYGSHPGQLGGMKAGNFEGAVSSPPFLVSSGGAHVPSNYADDPTFLARHAAGNKGSKAYGETAGQLSSMREVTPFRGAVSSPPYSDSNVGNDDGEKELRRLQMKAERGELRGEHLRLAKQGRLSPNENANLGKYGETPGQLAEADDFWMAAREIVEQVYESLVVGGHACWVVKDYVKNKQVVPFCDQWRELCEAVGFVTVHEHHASLVRNRRVQGMLEGGVEVKQSESKSFFRRLAEKKGSPRIDWETVLCMVKVSR